MKNIILIIFSLLMICGIKAQPTVLNVPENYQTISLALSNATTNDTILVQPGIYTENIIWPLVHGIKLLSAGDTTNTIIEGNGTTSVILFLKDFYYDSTTYINGFTITKGKNGISLEDANIFLDNINITKNHGTSNGGGIFCYYSNPIIRNISITFNTSSGMWARGGGICCFDSSPKITNVIISNNHLDGGIHYYGAGIFCANESSPFLNNVEISNNTTADNGSLHYGVGFYCGYNSNPILIGVQIKNNRSGNNADWYRGNGFYCDNLAKPYLQNVDILNNESGDGGILYLGGGVFVGGNSNPIFNNVRIKSNSTGSTSFQNQGGVKENMGGGIYVERCDTLTLKNVIISDNIVGDTNNQLQCFGGGIHSKDYYNYSTTLNLNNVTIIGNKRVNGLPIIGSGISSGKLFMKNTICRNENEGEEIHSNNANISYSNIRGGHEGEGNIDANPLFYSSNDLRLLPNSPCIDAGTLADILPYDIIGNPRPSPVGSQPDMGAYEMDNTPPEEVPISNSGIFLTIGLLSIIIMYGKKVHA